MSLIHSHSLIALDMKKARGFGQDFRVSGDTGVSGQEFCPDCHQDCGTQSWSIHNRHQHLGQNPIEEKLMPNKQDGADRDKRAVFVKLRGARRLVACSSS